LLMLPAGNCSRRTYFKDFSEMAILAGDLCPETD
jgi:hypothetical protein